MSQEVNPYKSPDEVSESVDTVSGKPPWIRYIICLLALVTLVIAILYFIYEEKDNILSLNMFSLLWFFNQFLSFGLFFTSMVLLIQKRKLFFTFFSMGFFSQIVIGNLRMFLLSGIKSTLLYNTDPFKLIVIVLLYILIFRIYWTLRSRLNEWNV